MHVIFEVRILNRFVAINAQKLWGSCDPGHAPPPLLEKILRGHVWTVPRNMHVKFEVRSLNRFGTPKNLGGHAIVATPISGLLKSIFFRMLREAMFQTW